MKYIYSLLAFFLIININALAQDYTYRYNPYSGMNQDQLNLALKQAQKLEKSGKVWTAVGTGMFVGGLVTTFAGIDDITLDGSGDYTMFGMGLGAMCFSAFPLGYGLIAWITGSEKVNALEIELLAFDTGNINIKPSQYGIGLVVDF